MSEEYKGPERRERQDRRHEVRRHEGWYEGWHLSKSIGITHIITTLGIVISVGGYFTSNEVRYSELKGHVQSLNYSIEGLKEERDRDRREINAKLNRVEAKLDRLIDKFVYTKGSRNGN